MTAPRLEPLSQARHDHPRLTAGLVMDPGVGTTAFVVVSAGAFQGCWLERGTVILCGGDARSGQAVVLVSRSPGRPRLGHVQGAGLYGDRGEPCSAARWMAAGRVVGILERRDQGWARVSTTLHPGRTLRGGTAQLGVGAPAGGPRWPIRGGAGRSPHTPAARSTGDQLDLFARAA
jgi:hypothetical protein